MAARRHKQALAALTRTGVDLGEHACRCGDIFRDVYAVALAHHRAHSLICSQLNALRRILPPKRFRRVQPPVSRIQCACGRIRGVPCIGMVIQEDLVTLAWVPKTLRAIAMGAWSTHGLAEAVLVHPACVASLLAAETPWVWTVVP